MMLSMNPEMASSNRNELILSRHGEGADHAEIGREVNLSRERVRQIIKKALGDSTPQSRRPETHHALVLRAMEAIQGGAQGAELAKVTGISLKRLDWLFLRYTGGCDRRVHEFHAWVANQVGQTYGSWVILAVHPYSPDSISKSRCRVTARCLSCGKSFEVGFRGILDGRSTMCQSCSTRVLSRQPVLEVETGRIFGAVKEARESLSASPSQVRTMLIRGKLKRIGGRISAEAPAGPRASAAT